MKKKQMEEAIEFASSRSLTDLEQNLKDLSFFGNVYWHNYWQVFYFDEDGAELAAPPLPEMIYIGNPPQWVGRGSVEYDKFVRSQEERLASLEQHTFPLKKVAMLSQYLGDVFYLACYSPYKQSADPIVLARLQEIVCSRDGVLLYFSNRASYPISAFGNTVFHDWHLAFQKTKELKDRFNKTLGYLTKERASCQPSRECSPMPPEDEDDDG